MSNVEHVTMRIFFYSVLCSELSIAQYVGDLYFMVFSYSFRVEMTCSAGLIGQTSVRFYIPRVSFPVAAYL
jgi:hypothetical protein